MKTFEEYGGDTVNPYYHSYGGSLLGPWSWSIYTSCRSQRTKTITQQFKKTKWSPRTGKEITKSDLDQIERYADRLFGAVRY